MKSVFLIVLALMTSSAYAAETYTVDPTHASVVFKANHLGFADVYGMFGATEGKITWDAENPSKSSFEVVVKADSLSTMVKKRDDHLKSPDFFNVKQFPTITMKSKSIKKLAANKFEVTADVTLHGVTKPVTFTMMQNKSGKDPWGKMRTGANATLNIKRTDFGMTYMSKPGEISDNIELVISVEAIKD